ncbi:MAG: penicillin-binding transpeptidase domain-containing protein, partial [Planctomycetota bacterium]
EGVAIHIVGWLRDHAQEEDIRRRATRIEVDRAFRERVMSEDDADRGFYDPALAERVGSGGVESSMESDLRGLRGQRIVQLETGSTRVVEAKRGRDVRLTLDIALQARIQAAMTPEVGLAMVQPWNKSPQEIAGADGQKIPNPAFRPVGTALAGAAVVLDVDSGEVLAMVSTPTFGRAEILAEGTNVFDPAGPWPALNRAIAKPYPPGSIAKPLMLVGAAKRGFYTPGEAIDCTGHLFPNQKNAFRCWLYKKWQIGESPIPNHTEQLGHALPAEDALCVSCNVFFYTLGQRMGPANVIDAYRDFGLGRRWDLGVGTEYPGLAGHTSTKNKVTSQEAIMMAIGQGPVEWTPLHAANAYATIARMGVWMNPRVLLDAPVADPVRLNLDSSVLIEALAGLGRSVNDEYGTGHHISVNGEREVTFDTDPTKVWIWGKTGTAAGLELIDTDGPEGPSPRERVEGDHSWYVILVGKAQERRPRYAVAVMMEYAGSGGKVSGPICNQIVHALLDEGYL